MFVKDQNQYISKPVVRNNLLRFIYEHLTVTQLHKFGNLQKWYLNPTLRYWIKREGWTAQSGIKLIKRGIGIKGVGGRGVDSSNLMSWEWLAEYQKLMSQTLYTNSTRLLHYVTKFTCLLCTVWVLAFLNYATIIKLTGLKQPLNYLNWTAVAKVTMW